MKPLLKSYVYFAPIASGIFFRGANAEFILKGKGLYLFLSKILAQFDGAQTLDDIKKPLNENQQYVVDKMVGELISKNMLHDNKAVLAIDLLSIEHEKFKVSLNYLMDKAPCGIEKFPDWREQNTLIIGSGAAQLALAEALLEQGIKNIWLLPLIDAVNVGSLTAEKTAFISELNNLYREVGSQIYIASEWKQLANTDISNCIFTQANLTQSMISSVMTKANLNKELLTGVITNIGNEQLVIVDNVLEKLSNCHEFSNIDMSIKEASLIQQQLSSAVIAQSLFDAFFDIARERKGVLVIDDSLIVNRHLLLSEQQNIDWDNPDSSDFLQSIAILEDDKFGIFGASNGDDLPQLPLSVDKLTISTKSSQKKLATDVVSWGHNLPNAKKQVLKKGISIYLKHTFGQECFSGFSEQDAKLISIYEINAKQLSLQKSLSITPLMIDAIEHSETKKLVNSAAIYGDKFSTYLIEDSTQGITSLAATLNGEELTIVSGIDKEKVLNELLAQLLLPIQLPNEEHSDTNKVQIKNCLVDNESSDFSALNNTVNPHELIANANITWLLIEHHPLVGLGVNAFVAKVNEELQGITYAA